VRTLRANAASDQLPNEVVKRLKGIETELQKIRQLLERMQDDDEDEEDRVDADN
jgi:hypothetical protein